MKYLKLILLMTLVFYTSSSMAREEISHYTCGMHPSVHVSVENYKKGDTKCPICSMPLTPVMKPQASSAALTENVISEVNIAAPELKLAGVRTERIEKRHLFKEIRTVGAVAFDPQLAVAQEEFLSSARSFEKAKMSSLPEVAERAERLLHSSWYKLKLLGLSDDQIEDLKNKKNVQTNLILPEKTMWIYGEIYEQDLPLVKQGAAITVTSDGLPGKNLKGTITSINPVLDKKTRTATFRALVDNQDLLLKPQMYVDVVIAIHYMSAEGEHAVVSMPKSALLDTGRRKIVWVDQGGGRFEGRAVQLGPELTSGDNYEDRYYPVLGGLTEGEQVVTKGNFLIDSQSQITGVAASAYGGAIGDEEVSAQPAGHVH